MANKDNHVPEKGEGNHEADRRYRDATKRFASNEEQVEQAALEAQKALEEESEALKAAEDAGRARIAEEDPEVKKRG